VVNFRTVVTGLVLLSCAGLVSAQKPPSKARLDAIWAAVNDRITDQVDIWFEDGDYPKSIHLLVFQATYAPDNYDVVTNLGWMQENVEDWDGALATYKLYWKNNPSDKDRALPEAEYLFRRKQYAQIPSLVEPVLKFQPHPNNYRVLAHSYEKLKKFEDAKRVWDAYIAIAPKDLTAKANLAKVEKKIEAAKTER